LDSPPSTQARRGLPFAAWLTLGFFLLLGVAARVAAYLHYRVLWLDEGYTGVTVVSKSFAEFFQPLGLFQILPPGYLVVAKICTLVGGVNEYAIRFPSLVAGLLSLVLFLVASRRWLNGMGSVIGFAFFSSAGLLIYYASETKPYAGDVCVAILLWWLAIEAGRLSHLSARWYAVLALAGALAVWFSLPSCFLLAGIGIYQFDRAVLRKDVPRVLRFVGVYAVGGASFLLLYFMVLRPGSLQPSLIQGENLMQTMRDSWHFGFLPFPPKSGADVQLYENQFLRLFWNPGGFKLTGLAAFFWLLGWWSIYKRDRPLFWILLNPFIVTFAVSLLRLYPFDGRMLLFLTPALFLVLGEGVAFLYEHLNVGARAAMAIALLLLLLPPTLRAARNVVAPPPRVEFDAALNYVEDQWRPEDKLFLGFYDNLTFRFCRTWYDFPESSLLTETAPFEEQHANAKEFAAIPREQLRGRRMWIPVWHHRGLDDFLKLVEAQGGRQVDYLDLGGPKAYAYQF
jgi:hypothetical protein